MKYLRSLFAPALFLLLAIVLCRAPVAIAAPNKVGPAKQNSDSAAAAAETESIRKSAAAFEAAFNQANAKALAAMWIDDGVLIDATGRRYTGKAAITAAYVAFFKANPGAKLNLSIENIHLISNTSAVEDGISTLDPQPAGAPAAAKYSAIHVKEGGRWLMANVREQRVELPSTYARLRGLEWMVGEWAGEYSGAEASISCRWFGQKSFLERSITVTRADRKISSSREIIGWDAVKGRITSWSYNTGGSRAEGLWSPQPGGWLVETVGVDRNGVASEALITWQRLGNGALGWQSESRKVGNRTVNTNAAAVFKPVKK